ncbi:hypothetical protein ACLKA7_006264 [Drosophila subpalustris]
MTCNQGFNIRYNSITELGLNSFRTASYFFSVYVDGNAAAAPLLPLPQPSTSIIPSSTTTAIQQQHSPPPSPLPPPPFDAL